jgi:hypothetical protein
LFFRENGSGRVGSVGLVLFLKVLQEGVDIGVFLLGNVKVVVVGLEEEELKNVIVEKGRIGGSARLLSTDTPDGLQASLSAVAVVALAGTGAVAAAALAAVGGVAGEALAPGAGSAGAALASGTGSVGAAVALARRKFHYGAIVTNCWTSPWRKATQNLHLSRRQPAQTAKTCPIQWIRILAIAQILFPSNLWIIPKKVVSLVSLL